MQWHGLRIPVILLALVAGLVVFFGARWLYNKFSLEEPLAGALKASPAVQSFEIEKGRTAIRIIVHLAPTANLKETYHELYRQAQSVLGRQRFEIKIVDNRDEKLNRVFYSGQFAVYEAIKRGNYREMIKELEAEAAKAGATAAVFLDQENIYVQLQDNEHYLYEIIPRREPVFFPSPTEKFAF